MYITHRTWISTNGTLQGRNTIHNLEQDVNPRRLERGYMQGKLALIWLILIVSLASLIRLLPIFETLWSLTRGHHQTNVARAHMLSFCVISRRSQWWVVDRILESKKTMSLSFVCNTKGKLWRKAVITIKGKENDRLRACRGPKALQPWEHLELLSPDDRIESSLWKFEVGKLGGKGWSDLINNQHVI